MNCNTPVSVGLIIDLYGIVEIRVQLFFSQCYGVFSGNFKSLIECFLVWKVGPNEFYLGQHLLCEYHMCWPCDNGSSGQKRALFGCYAFALEKMPFLLLISH